MPNFWPIHLMPKRRRLDIGIQGCAMTSSLPFHRTGAFALPGPARPDGFLTPLLCSNAVVFFSGYGNSWHVSAVNRADSSPLFEIAVPAQPFVGGLSMTPAGDVMVPLVDGRVVCIGSDAN